MPETEAVQASETPIEATLPQDAETPTVEAQPDTAVQAEQADGGEQEQDTDRPQRRGGYQRRINQLTKQMTAVIDFYEGRTTGDALPAALWSRIQKARHGETVDVPELDEAYRVRDRHQAIDDARDGVAEALADHDALAPITPDPARYDQPETDPVEQARAEGRHQSAHESLQRRLQAAGERDADLQRAADSIELPQSLVGFLGHALADIPNGEDVFAYLAHNPQACQGLAQMDGVGVIGQIHRISAGLEFGGSRQAPATTKAPRPPQPVGRTTAADTDELRDDLSTGEWARRFRRRMARADGR